MSTRINWADETINPIVGCIPISAGCDHCYAARFASRGLTLNHRGVASHGMWNGKLRYDWSQLDKPLRWRKPRRIFLCSMSDVFNRKIPLPHLQRIVRRIQDCPQHEWVILTKRPHIALEFFGTTEEPIPNLTLGVSVENEETAHERIPILLQIPAARRIVSFEPALGPVEFSAIWRWCPTHDFPGGFCHGPCPDARRVDEIIAGPETGPGARPCDPAWLQSAADQCRAAGVAFWLKAGTLPDGTCPREWCR